LANLEKVKEQLEVIQRTTIQLAVRRAAAIALAELRGEALTPRKAAHAPAATPAPPPAPEPPPAPAPAPVAPPAPAAELDLSDAPEKPAHGLHSHSHHAKAKGHN
jgi:hypothetical protein